MAADPAASAAVVAASTLVFRLGTGQREVAVPGAAATMPARQLEPTRRPASYRGMRNYIGRCCVPADADGPAGGNGSSSVWFESFNELAHIRDLVLTENPTCVSSQPVLVVWRLPGGNRYHFPDLMVTRAGAPTLVVDVTRKVVLTRPIALAQFMMMAATARAAGWAFQVRTELPSQRVRTQSHIWCHRNTDAMPGYRLPTARAGRWPLPLGRLAALMRSLGDVSPVLALVARHELFLDFDEPLSLASLVHREPLLAPAPWVMSL